MLIPHCPGEVTMTLRGEVVVPQHRKGTPTPHLFILLFFSSTYFKDKETDARRREALAKAILLITEEPELILINLVQPSILFPT